MRFYEVVTPLRALATELQVKNNHLVDDLDSHRKQIKSLTEVQKTFSPFSFHFSDLRECLFIESALPIVRN